MKKRSIGKILIFALLIIVFVARAPILKAIGSYLVVQDELEKADVIVVLAGESGRVDEAACLFQQGWAGHMIMSGGSLDKKYKMAEGMRRQAVALGVPQNKIILEPEAVSTYQHPVLIMPLMRKHDFDSAIIVTSPYHMRRSAMVFDRVFKDSGIKLIYYPVQDSWFDADRWWTEPGSRRTVGSEYGKMAVNMWGNKFSAFVVKWLNR